MEICIYIDGNQSNHHKCVMSFDIVIGQNQLYMAPQENWERTGLCLDALSKKMWEMRMLNLDFATAQSC